MIMTNVPISGMHVQKQEDHQDPTNQQIPGNSSHTRRNFCLLLTMLCIGFIFGSNVTSAETPRIFMQEGDLERYIQSPQGQAHLYDQGCYDTFEYTPEVFAKLKNGT